MKTSSKLTFMYQCKNCKKRFRDNYKLRRHFLSYLPYYFGSYICVFCEISFETELKLLKHILKLGHKSESVESCDILAKRKAFFENEDNKYFGSGREKFDESDIDYLIKHKGITNFDIRDVLGTLSNLDKHEDKQPAMDFNSRIVTPNFYDSINNSSPVTTSFEANVLPPNCEKTCFPSPPSSKNCLKRKVGCVPSFTVTSQEQHSTLDFDQRLTLLETRLDNLEDTLKTEIQTIKSDIMSKIDIHMQYQHQLFESSHKQLKQAMRESLKDMLQGALSSTQR